MTLDTGTEYSFENFWSYVKSRFFGFDVCLAYCTEFPCALFFRIRASRRQKVVDQLFKHGRILSSIETKKNWLFSIYFAQRNETFLQVSPQNVCEKYDVDNWCCFPIQATRRGWYATQNLSELWNNNLNARKKRKHTQYLCPIGEEIGVQLAFK